MDIFFSEIHAILQIISAGLVFGIAHGFWGFTTGSARKARKAIKAIKAITVLGWILGGIYIISGRNLAPPVSRHILS